MWKVWNATIFEGYEYAVLRKKDFAKLTKKAGRISSTFLLSPELIWGSSYARDHVISSTFRETIRFTNYYFHAPMYTIIELFITLAVVLTNREMWTVQNAPWFWKVMNMLFWEGRDFAKLTPKAGRTSSTLLLSHLSWYEVPPMLGVMWYHLPFREPIRLTNYNFHSICTEL